MNRHIHHPSCPARYTAGAACECRQRRRRGDTAAEWLAFCTMLGFIVMLPLYVLVRFTA